MTRAARSILVFGIYLVGTGLVDTAGAMWTRAALRQAAASAMFLRRRGAY
jgi:hypothetical protein